MTMARRTLEAVTLSRVVVGLLIAAFAREFLLGFILATHLGSELFGAVGGSALVIAAATMALEACLLYLVVQLVLVVLRRRGRGPAAGQGEHPWVASFGDGDLFSAELRVHRQGENQPEAGGEDHHH